MLNLNPEEKERLVREDIQQNGYSIIYVVDDEEVLPPFAYSVGFYQTYRHPEIIIVGTTDALANPVLNAMACRIEEEGVRYEAGRYYGDILVGVDCYMHAVREDCYPDYVGWDLWYYDGYRFPLLQCVYPCKEGHFPWDPQAPQVLVDHQPIIGGLQGH